MVILCSVLDIKNIVSFDTFDLNMYFLVGDRIIKIIIYN